MAHSLEFWRRHLDGAPPLMDVITDRHRNAANASLNEAGSVRFEIPRDTAFGLTKLCHDRAVNMHTVLLSAWQIFLARYSRVDDIVVGTIVRHAFHQTLVPIRLELPAGNPQDATAQDLERASFVTVLDHMKSVKREVLRNCGMPWEQLSVELCPDAGTSATPVFQVLFSCFFDEEVSSSGYSFVGRETALHPPTTHADPFVDYDLELHVNGTTNSDTSGPISSDLLFRKSVFDPLTVQRMSQHFTDMLASVAKTPSSKWFSLPICSESERKLVLDTLNQTSARYPDTKCIHDLFEDMAVEYPTRPCITYHQTTMQWKVLTYGEVYCRAMTVATQLRRMGVRPDTPVPILLERSHLQVIAIYGVLLAGGCYVPIDADYPSDRVYHMLKDAAASTLITDTKLMSKVPSEFTGHKLTIDTFGHESLDIPLAAAKRRNDVNQSPDSNVYIFYTSGTTGLPKGVEVTHRGLVKRAQWLQDSYTLTPEDKCIYKTPFTFGISEWELFWPMPFGAQIVVCKEGGQKDPEYLLQVTRYEKVTICTYVPSMLAMLTEYMIAEGLNYATDMRHVICCGEALPVETCHKFFEVFDPEVTRLHNFYGPTEADMTFWECPKLVPGEDHVLTRIPIGKPMSNVKVYILDQWKNPVPAGVPGELYFGGVTTAKGYLGLPELTAEKFVENPFRKLGDCPRMYRTGDCARWMPDLTTLEFLGRVDNQVKLRGFRIELGEIESVIGTCEGVVKVAVVVDGAGAAARIIAYVEPRTIQVKNLLITLKSKVPEYMVPSVIMPMDSLPLTSRGKLDRKALPKPPKGTTTAADAAAPSEFRGAESAKEKAIESIWQRILNRTEPIDVNANFLSMGGNSLLAGRVTTLIRKETGSMIPSTAMYQHPTIAKISELCEKHKPEESSFKGPVVGGNRFKRWGGYSSTNVRTLICHAIGMLLESFTTTAAFLPGFMYLFGVYYEEGKWAALGLLPFILALTMITVTTYTILVKKFLLGRVLPGEYPLWSGFYLKWWLVHNLHRSTIKMIAPFVEETVLYNKYLSLMGASIGDRVAIGSDDIFDPDLITIEDDVVIERKATLIPHSVENGILSFWPIHINQHCRVLPVGWVTPGTRLPPGTEVGPLSTTGMSARDIRKGSRMWQGISNTQNLARICLIPVILAMEALAYLPAVTFLEYLWVSVFSVYFSDSNLKYCLFYLCIPWVDKLVAAETFFLMTVAYKWIVIGRFKPGKNKPSFSMDLKKWFLERLTHHQQYKFATQPWINTELLAQKYRMMGVKMGFKVQTDFVEILEFDLLSVGADAVFGSNVTVIPTDHHESRRVYMQAGSQVLDHSTLMPGCIVGRGALCGSSTIGAKFYKFPPLSISTGNQQGKPVQLRVLTGNPNQAGAFTHLPPDEKDMALMALRNHQNNWRWGTFNMFNIITVMFIAPLPAVADLFTVLVWLYMEQFEVFQKDDPYSVAMSWIVTILVTPPAYLIVQVIETFAFIIFKWAVVGKYREGNFPFYGSYHRKWVIMMAVKEAIGKLLETLGGTAFYVWFFRAMGGEVGKDVFIMGYGLEYDLFHIGDQSAVGIKCDVTCHTVENMVIKLQTTRVKNKCTMKAGALVQPGGVVLDGAVIMENSQVLKGGEVGEDQVWAGLPAEPVQRILPELASDTSSGGTATYSIGHQQKKTDYRACLVMLLFLLTLWLIPGKWTGGAGYGYASDLHVRTAQGIIRGEPLFDTYGTVYGVQYAGIPYAEPPIDRKRWQAPIPPTAWTNVRASHKQPSCVDASGGSEDCLYLDVSAPQTKGKDLHPVVVWFHGGCESWARPENHIGSAMLNSVEDVVVVTASSRVAAMGYLHHPDLEGTSNIGLLDQRAVLQWVQKNIKGFGGDPNRVVLFAQSSGTGSVIGHLVSPGSWGLFHRVILQSVPMTALVAKTEAAAHLQATSIISQIPTCSESIAPTDSLKCLMKQQAMTITSTGNQLCQCKEGKEGCSGAAWTTCGEHRCPWGLMIDKEIRDQPWRLIENGEHAKVPVLIGHRMDDGSRSMGHTNQPADSADELQWREWAETAFHPIPETTISRHYPAQDYAERASKTNRSASWHAALAARTDQLYACGTRKVAQALTKTAPTYVYTCDQPLFGGVHNHMMWFQTEGNRKETVFDRAIAAQSLSYWSNFIQTGEPRAGIDTTAELAEWEKFGEAEKTLLLHMPATMGNFLSSDVCKDAWELSWMDTTRCLESL